MFLIPLPLQGRALEGVGATGLRWCFGTSFLDGWAPRTTLDSSRSAQEEKGWKLICASLPRAGMPVKNSQKSNKASNKKNIHTFRANIFNFIVGFPLSLTLSLHLNFMAKCLILLKTIFVNPCFSSEQELRKKVVCAYKRMWAWVISRRLNPSMTCMRLCVLGLYVWTFLDSKLISEFVQLWQLKKQRFLFYVCKAIVFCHSVRALQRY